MGDHHHFGRPSLLLASHDRAHREHKHRHHLLHRADTGVIGAIVKEVVATVSVIQEVTVDLKGITIGRHTFTADSTGGTSFPPTITENATPSTTTARPRASSTGSKASSTASASGPGDQKANNAAAASPPQSLLSVQNIESASAATPISSIPTTLALILASNSTPTSLIPVSSATSLTPSFSNSFSNSSTSTSTLSGSSSSSVFINLQSSSTTNSDESSTSLFASTSSVYSSGSTSSPSLATSTDGVVGGGAGEGATGTGSGGTSTCTPAAGNGDAAISAPAVSTVVGGVVGGVAGAAILIVLVMILIRWKRRNSSMLALGSGEGDAAAATARNVPPPSQPPGGMAERASFGGFAVPAALASLTGYKRSPQRMADRNTISSTAGSERGFYRVSGRKLPSVLQSGGDGYGGGIMDSNTMSGSSSYRVSQGFYGGPGGPSSPPAGFSMARDSGVPIMREGPARTPVTEQGPFANPPAASLTPPPRRPDVVGRSHPSFDVSQRSRFTEEV